MKRLLQIVKNYVRFGRNSAIDEQVRLFRLGRDEFKYCENDRCLVFQIELLSGVPNRLIYKSTISKWLPPFDRDEFSFGDGDRVANKVKAFWEAEGYSVVIQD